MFCQLVFIVVVFVAILKSSNLWPNHEKYLVYLPYEGTFNQLWALQRALLLAQSTDRILILPPLLTNNKHFKELEIRSWTEFFQLRQEIRPLLTGMSFKCHTSTRFSTLEALGSTVTNLIDKYQLRIQFIYHNKELLNWSELIELARSNERIVCLAQMQHITKVPETKALSWTPWMRLSNTSFDLVIHDRKGDFHQICQHRPHCLLSNLTLQTHLNRMKEQHPLFHTLFIMSNENESNDNWSASEWQVTIGKNGTLLDLMKQVQAATQSQYFIGNRYSSLSKWIHSHRLLHQKKSEYFT